MALSHRGLESAISCSQYQQQYVCMWLLCLFVSFSYIQHVSIQTCQLPRLYRFFMSATYFRFAIHCYTAMKDCQDYRSAYCALHLQVQSPIAPYSLLESATLALARHLDTSILRLSEAKRLPPRQVKSTLLRSLLSVFISGMFAVHSFAG